MSRFSLHHGDALAWLRTLEDESVALCVTDPAYASLEKHRAKGTTTRLKVSDGSSNAWFDVVHNSYFAPFLRELHRVLAKDAHLYVLCDQETAFDVIKPAGIAAGFMWWKALVWEKTRETAREGDEDGPGPSAGMGYHYRAAFEHVCFLEKGKRRLADLGICDVLRFPRVRKWSPCICGATSAASRARDEDGFLPERFCAACGRPMRAAYPTEKPVGLLRTLIEQSSSPGDLVIDPFNGSGSCGEASLRAGRLYAGADVAEGALNVSRQRLQRLGPEGATTTPRRPKAQQGDLFGGLVGADHREGGEPARSPTAEGDEADHEPSAVRANQGANRAGTDEGGEA